MKGLKNVMCIFGGQIPKQTQHPSYFMSNFHSILGSSIENPGIRYVGVIWFVSMFSNFYQSDVHNETCVAWSINNIQIENWTSPSLVMVVGSAYIGPPNCVCY